MPAPLAFDELWTRVLQLDRKGDDFCCALCALRDQIDENYDQRLITLHQWRLLMEEASIRQARYALVEPDGWRCGMRSSDASETDTSPTLMNHRH